LAGVHEDFGEKIGGAKKDLWKDRGLYADDLEAMNEREAEKFVKKDNVWKKPDYAAILEEGIPLGVVYFIKKARDGLNASPQYYRTDDTPEKRTARQKEYIKTVRELQAVLSDVRTAEDAVRAYDRFFVDNGYLEKGLLSLMLSLPEDWDYTTKGLAHICKDGVDSITTALKELERHGYLTRQRLRYDNGQLGDIEYTIHEQPVSTENIGLSPKRENPRQVKPEQAKPKQAEPEQENPAQLNTNPLKTKKSKKDKSITYPSIYPAEPEAANRTDGMDRIELIEAYREIIKENIEYDLLVLRYGRERLDETLELMLEVILSKRPYIRIAGDDFPREIVKSRFLKINSGHLEYVFDCIDKNTTKVGNIKAYLLAALYNAPATMDSYYRAEVNHDLYGC
jgi:hypothetical protein